MLIEKKEDKLMRSQWVSEAIRWRGTDFSTEAQRGNVLRQYFLWEVVSPGSYQSPGRESISGEAGGKPCISGLCKEEGFGGWSLGFLVPFPMQRCSVEGWICMPGFNP